MYSGEEFDLKEVFVVIFVSWLQKHQQSRVENQRYNLLRPGTADQSEQMELVGRRA